MAKGATDLKQGRYSDGHPLDEVQYLECKIILKPDRFTSVDSFREFGKLVRRTAGDVKKVDFIKNPSAGQRPSVREVVFLDTGGFGLYNNAFILRRRIAYNDGFPVGDPEIVFKFRHPDLQRAAELDVRPNIPGRYRIKFKAEALPLRDRIGGLRILYSHNCEFGLSQVHDEHRTAMSTLSHVFPALSSLKEPDSQEVSLVNGAIVEEVLLDLDKLDFGKGVVAKTNVALWRTRGDHKPLVGEFAYQCRFERARDVHIKARRRCEQFFIALQHAASDWISLGTTKTGAVYRLHGNAPQSHE
ncbi:MAG: hypothetical protein ACREKS_04415 [Candidatus Rokuibacteriota bacterium]